MIDTITLDVACCSLSTQPALGRVAASAIGLWQPPLYMQGAFAKIWWQYDAQ